MGQRDRDGYGIVSLFDHKMRAPRFAWIVTNGPLPDATLIVLHRCDNPPCCNPDHLSLGNHADNMRDMAAKGRGANQHGRHRHKYMSL